MKKNAALTLIELLITLAVISIITAIAVPQYNSYRNKEVRSDAVRSMLKISMELERCRSRNGDGSYTNCPSTQNITLSKQRHYNIAVALTNNDSRYTMTATKLGKADTVCSTLTLTHDGLRDASSSDGNLNTVRKRLQRCWGS